MLALHAGLQILMNAATILVLAKTMLLRASMPTLQTLATAAAALLALNGMPGMMKEHAKVGTVGSAWFNHIMRSKHIWQSLHEIS